MSKEISKIKITRYLRLRRQGVNKHKAVKQVGGGRYSTFMSVLKTRKIREPIKAKEAVRAWRAKKAKISLIRRRRPTKEEITETRTRVKAKGKLVLPMRGRYCEFPYSVKRTEIYKEWKSQKKSLRWKIKTGVPQEQYFLENELLKRSENEMMQYAIRCFDEIDYDMYTEEALYYH